MVRKLLSFLRSPLKNAIKQGMRVGKGVSVMGGANFGSEPYLITLEDGVRLSHGVCLITHDGGSWAFRFEQGWDDIHSFGKIVVGEGSFIGANATIMPGVRIGKHCVIGAGAVVTKNIPDYSVAVGVPARVITDTWSYAEKMRARMPENWDENAYNVDKKGYLIRIISEP